MAAGGFDPVSYLMGQRSVDPNAEYYTKAQADVLLNKKQNNLQYETDTIATNEKTVTINYDGTFINAYVLENNTIVACDISVTLSSVTFTVKNKPSTALTCVVVYG